MCQKQKARTYSNNAFHENFHSCSLLAWKMKIWLFYVLSLLFYFQLWPSPQFVPVITECCCCLLWLTICEWQLFRSRTTYLWMSKGWQSCSAFCSFSVCYISFSVGCQKILEAADFANFIACDFKNFILCRAMVAGKIRTIKFL